MAGTGSRCCPSSCGPRTRHWRARQGPARSTRRRTASVGRCPSGTRAPPTRWQRRLSSLQWRRATRFATTTTATRAERLASSRRCLGAGGAAARRMRFCTPPWGEPTCTSSRTASSASSSSSARRPAGRGAALGWRRCRPVSAAQRGGRRCAFACGARRWCRPERSGRRSSSSSRASGRAISSRRLGFRLRWTFQASARTCRTTSRCSTPSSSRARTR
mmetsp:Transcript_13304/g.43986  ORF Transcript_13304/g.43986 Transcript_13304/m.43986 type:complete len:218 (+) Transcript_13304:561-1214(+)